MSDSSGFSWGTEVSGNIPQEVVLDVLRTIATNLGLLVSALGINYLKGYTFANLPAAPNPGTIADITDSNTIVWGAAIAGGGGNRVLGWWNGAAWTVIGK